jgi:formyltetrahydrofolate-dependent phosphoribosylglycinamide formyltransferase
LYNKVKKIKTAVFISGRGSNMESLIKSAGDQNFSALIAVVISNNELAPGIALAKNYNVPVEIFDKKKFDKSQFENNAQRVLLNYKIEIICLAGFMQILSKNFINNWQNRIINIHPSYLPKNKGLNPQKQVINERATFTGCTVHFVNEKIDSGKIILQEKIKVMQNDNVQSLSDRILQREHEIYPKALNQIASNMIRVKN